MKKRFTGIAGITLVGALIVSVFTGVGAANAATTDSATAASSASTAAATAASTPVPVPAASVDYTPQGGSISGIDIDSDHTTVGKVVANGVTELAYVMANGYHPKVKTKDKHGHKLKIAVCDAHTTSAKLAAIVKGIQHGIYSTKVDMRAGCTGDDTGIYPDSKKSQTLLNTLKKREWGYYDPKIKAIRRSICGNPFRPHKKSTVVTIAQFHITQYGVARITSALDISQDYSWFVAAIAYDSQGRVCAKSGFELDYTATAHLEASVYANIKTSSSISTKLSAHQRADSGTQKTKIDANANTQYSTKLSLHGTAWAICYETPATPQAPTVTVDTMQNVKQGLTSLDTIHFAVPSGTATVSIHTVYGTILDGTSNGVTVKDNVATVSGTSWFQFTYLAPAEPVTVTYYGTDGLVLQPGQDAITVTITNADGSASSRTIFNVPANPTGH